MVKDTTCRCRSSERTFLSDKELIASARKGDRSAFEKLVKKYESRVAATVVGMLGRGPAAQDVGVATFVSFYKNINAFKEESSLATYLTRIAINLSLNEIKRRKRQRTLISEVSEVEHIQDERHTIEQTLQLRELRDAVLRLDPKFRAVIVLRLIEGLSTEETAQILKIPVGTVLSRLSRGQRMLRKMINGKQ